MRILSTILLAFTLACNNGGDTSTKDGTCGNNADCPDNFLCLEEQCVEIGCTESTECALGYYCDASYSCTPGCSEDVDCVAGESCNTTTNTCEAYGCRDTELDCEYGEYCDQTTGECYPDNRNLCGTCDVLAMNSCGNGAECLYYAGDYCNNDNDCDEGYSCDPGLDLFGKICHLDFCFFECNANDAEACPRGYTCAQAIQGDPRNFCIADCEFMQNNGYSN